MHSSNGQAFAAAILPPPPISAPNWNAARIHLAILSGATGVFEPEIFVPLDDDAERHKADRQLIAEFQRAKKADENVSWPQLRGPRYDQMRLSLTDAWHTLIVANQQRAGIFAAVNAFDGKPAPGKQRGVGRTRENLIGVRAVWADDDAPRHDGPRTDWPIRPLIVTETSPGKFQYFWPVAGLTIDQCEAVNRSIAETFGTDMNAVDAARVLRVAGFSHCKRADRPFQVRLAHYEFGRYTREQIIDAFPPIDRPVRQPRALSGQSELTDVDIAVMRSALAAIPSEDDEAAGDRSVWIKIGMALYAWADGEDIGGELFAEWSWNADEAWGRWSTFRARGDVTAGTIFWMAGQYGWSHDGARAEAIFGPPIKPFTSGAPDAIKATDVQLVQAPRRAFHEIEADLIKLAGHAVNPGFDNLMQPLLIEIAAGDYSPVQTELFVSKLRQVSGNTIGKPTIRAALSEIRSKIAEQKQTEYLKRADMTEKRRAETLQKLIRTDTNKIVANIANAELYLDADADWRGAVGYDEFSHQIMIRRPLPWSNDVDRQWSDHDTTRLLAWLQMTCNGMEGLARSTIEHLPLMIARKNTFHPIREYLQSLAWDGAKRLDTFAEAYLGAAPEDEMQRVYLRAVSPKFFIGAVARVMQPGCKLDTAIILESETQGVRKSTLFKTLATRDEWFSDSKMDIGSKDGMQALCGVWIYELSELDALDKKTAETNKSFLSSSTDKFRPPYGRTVETFPRQCVLVGSTNKNDYLRDPTGNRRYWPIECADKIDIAIIKRDIGQLWAEAYARYSHGEQWWLYDHEEQAAKREQDDRMSHDSMTGDVLKAAMGFRIRTKNDYVTVDQIVTEMQFDDRNHDLRFKGRIGNILKRNNFRYARPRLSTSATRERVFYYP